MAMKQQEIKEDQYGLQRKRHKKWTAQWFETNVMGEKKKRRKRGFETKREALEFERSKKLSNDRSFTLLYILEQHYGKIR